MDQDRFSKITAPDFPPLSYLKICLGASQDMVLFCHPYSSSFMQTSSFHCSYCLQSCSICDLFPAISLVEVALAGGFQELSRHVNLQPLQTLLWLPCAHLRIECAEVLLIWAAVLTLISLFQLFSDYLVIALGFFCFHPSDALLLPSCTDPWYI